MMNEPIISPWIFYVADVVGSINLVINVLMWILCIATAIAFCDYMSSRSPYKVTNYITPANIDKASDIVDKITDKIIEKINKRDK